MENQYNYYNPNIDPEQEPGEKKPKRSHKSSHKIIGLLGAAIIFGVVASGTFLTMNTVGSRLLGLNSGGIDSSRTVKTTDTSNNGTASLTTSNSKVNSDVSQIVQNTMPSVVSITSMSVQQVQNFFGQISEQESQGAGTGIIIGQNDSELLIVTNNHVIEGSDELTVTFDDDASVEASIKGTDASNDVAVIAVALDQVEDATMDHIAVATLGDSTALQVGEPVIAIGNALGYGQSVTTGIVSATDRSISATEEDESSVKLIQTDAAINPGNSGGPLLNVNGEVIGINSAKLAANEVEGMGYAIPVSSVSDIITNLMNQETKTKVAEGEKGYLGISGVDVTEESAARYDMPTGVYVSEAINGGGAERAGITKGCIITEMEGVIIDSMSTLQEELKYYAQGDSVEITIQTPGSNGIYDEKTVEVTLGKQPNN